MRELICIGILFGLVLIPNLVSATGDNGTLTLNITMSSSMHASKQGITPPDTGIEKVEIVKLEGKREGVMHIAHFKINQSHSNRTMKKEVQLGPGTYILKVKYKGKKGKWILDGNGTGYEIKSGESVIVPLAQNSPDKDVLADIPWAARNGNLVPILLLVKDVDLLDFYPAYKVYIYDAGQDLTNTNDDIEKYAIDLDYDDTCWGTPVEKIDQDFWYKIVYVDPSRFTDHGGKIYIRVRYDAATLCWPSESDWDMDDEPMAVGISSSGLLTLADWYAGDTHYHSNYTDNDIEFGYPIEATVEAGKAIGLDWITVTDHSFDLDSTKFSNLGTECNTTYSDSSFKCIRGEEISAYLPGTTPTKYNHYLAYGANFIAGGEWEDGTTSDYTPAQVVSMANSQGGFGYPAHPMHGDLFRDPWQDYSLDFTGLQVWNYAQYIDSNQELLDGLDRWVSMLTEGRHVFIEGGSDSHGNFNDGLGKVRTYVYIPGYSQTDVPPQSEILNALKYGHSIMTDGPIVTFTIDGEIIGNTVTAVSGTELTLNVRWKSTSEFGNFNFFTIKKGVIGQTGEENINVPLTGLDLTEDSYEMIITPTQDSYYRIQSGSGPDPDGNYHKVYTNPIWVSVVADTTPPTPPTLITPSGTIGTTTPTFNWTAATDDLSGIDKYHIQVDDDISFGSPEINTTTTSTSYTAPSGVLSNWVTYYWRVGVWDRAGNWGGFTDRWSITIDIKPDLTLQSGDISFSDSSPSDGDNVLISAIVSNTGDLSASNVKVRFSHDGTQIGSDYVITSIGAGGSASAWVTWYNVEYGTHDIEVTIDPDNTITEANETNNYAERSLSVGGVTDENWDLTFFMDQFSFHRDDWDVSYVGNYNVDYRAFNKGTTDADDVYVVLEVDGTEVDYDYFSLPALIGYTQHLEWYPINPGRYDLTVKIDPYDSYPEGTYENNNEWTIKSNIMGGISDIDGYLIDKWIYDSGCSVEKTNFKIGEPICVKIDVRYYQSWDSNAVDVDFFVYRDVGTEAYELIDIVEKDFPDVSGNSRKTVTYQNVWTSTEEGDLFFWIYVHDDSDYSELYYYVPDEYLAFTVKPDLTLSSTDITFTPASPLKGDNVTIAASIHNDGETAKDVLVKFYNGDPSSGGLEIGSDTLPIIWAGSTGGASMIWENVALDSHSIYVVADPPPSTIDESNEGNNKASKIMPVVNTPPLLSDIPSRSTGEDEEPSSNFIDLYTHASDIEDTDAQLTFSIQSQSNSSLISCTIVSDRYVDCGTPAANQYGSSTVVIKVTDTDSLTDTDDFVMTVNSVNDAPTIPTSLTPTSGTYGEANNIVSISCGGSTDVEGDAVYYNILGRYDGFWHDLELEGDGIYDWDISSLTSQTGVDLNCSATDLADSSAYFNPAGTLEIDNPPPAITIASPPNDTITDTTPDLNFTVDKAVNTTYSWNDEGNISGCRNCTSYGTTYGESAPETSTSLLLHLNEDFGNAAYDDSGYGNDGDISGATWTTGRFGRGLSFNATAGDTVSVPDAVGLDGVDNLTIMFWAKWDNLGLWKRVLEKTNAYFFDIGSSDRIYLQAYNDTGFTYSYASTPLQPGTWYFVAGVYDGSTGQVRMYIDGEDVTAGATGTARGGIRNNPSNLCLGAQGTGCATSDFNGTLDEVHILDRALNATEIAAYYNRGLSDGQHNVTVYAKDAASNINSSTKWFTVDTSENTPPIYSNDVDDSGGSILEGDDLSISVYWDDNFDLDTGILRTNKTGTWVNETFKKFTSTPQWFNATIDTAGFGGKTICWNQIANDTSDNWNDTMPEAVHCFEVRPRYMYYTIDETFDREINNTQPYWWDSITLTGNASATVTDEQSRSGSQSLRINNGNSTNDITMVRYFTTLHGGNITYSVSYYINNTDAFLYYYIRGKTETGIVKTPIGIAFKNIAGSTSEIGIRDPYSGS